MDTATFVVIHSCGCRKEYRARGAPEHLDALAARLAQDTCRSRGCKKPRSSGTGRRPSAETARLGGRAAQAKFGPEGRRALAQQGGRANAKRHGAEHFQALGRRGGGQTLARHGKEHFRAIGEKGRTRVRELIRRGKEREARDDSE